jgi:hypothetical protein
MVRHQGTDGMRALSGAVGLHRSYRSMNFAFSPYSRTPIVHKPQGLPIPYVNMSLPNLPSDLVSRLPSDDANARRSGTGTYLTVSTRAS